jgi:hypothetical protein
MQVIAVKNRREVPKYYTGIVKWGGATFWLLKGLLHRKKGGPAIEWPSGGREWYLNGKRHRKNGPAAEYPNGSKEWWLDNRCLFTLPKEESRQFILIEELEKGKQIKVLTQKGIEVWPNLPGLKELADNWENKK